MINYTSIKTPLSRSGNSYKDHPKSLSILLRAIVLLITVVIFPTTLNAQQTNLNDGDGFLWDIYNGRYIINGTNDAFDGYGYLSVNGTSFNGGPLTLELGGRQPVYGPTSIGGLNVTRKVYVPQTAGWARFLEYFENPTASPISIDVRWWGNLGSDGQGPAAGDIVTTFTGDTVFTPADRWVTTDDFSDGSGDPSLSHNFWGEFAIVQPSATTAGGDNLYVDFQLTIQPYSTEILMVFIAQNSNRTAALAKANLLDSLTIDPGTQIDALFGVSAADQLRIRNWTLSDDVDEDTVLNVDDNCPSTANLLQEDFDGDSFGDVCDTCPEIANPDQDETAACIAVTPADTLCMVADVELLLTDFLVEGDVTVETLTTFPLLSFAKLNGAGTSVFDNIDTNLKIARGCCGGVYNLGSDVTEWAAGTCAAPTSSFFTSHSDMLRNVFRYPVNVNLPGSETCLHNVTTDTHYDVLWSSWSSGALGGFAYTRTQVSVLVPLVTTGYMDSILPGDVDITALANGNYEFCVSAQEQLPDPGPPVSFKRPVVGDEISQNLEIVRGTSRGVHNYGSDEIEWAVGSCAAPTSSFFSDFDSFLRNHFRPVNTNLPGSTTCLRNITTGETYDVLWNSWSCCGQGGFEYTRTGPLPGGGVVTYTEANNTPETLLGDVISANLEIDRGTNRGVFNDGSDAIRWAVGTCAAPTTNFESDFNQFLRNHFRNPNPPGVTGNLPGSDTCLYNVTAGVFYDIHWDLWASRGASGFAYTRVGPVASFASKDCTSFTKSGEEVIVINGACNQPPEADAGGPYSVDEGSSTPLDGSASSDPDGDPLTYEWDFDYDGVTFDVDASGSANPSFSAAALDGPLTVTVAVRVTDDSGEFDVDDAEVTVNNVAPTATLGAPASVDEGLNIALSLSDPSDPSSADTTAGFEYSFDCGSGYGAFGVSSSTSCSTVDDEVRAVGGKIRDKDGGETEYMASVTVNNVAPVIGSVTGDTIDEDGTATVSGTFSDVGTADSFTVTIDWGEGAPEDFWYASGSTGFSETHQYLDDNPTATPSDNYAITVTVTDDDSGFASDSSAVVTVNNVDPVVGVIGVDLDLIPIGTLITASASFTDVGTEDTHAATWDWGDGSTSGTVTQGAGSGSVEDPHTYNVPGVYTIELTLTDDDTGTETVSYQFVVVYDPNAGFVTGGGWIDSPLGAYLPDPTLTGKANFGFVSKYKKGKSTPEGTTEFQFKAGDINFHSNTYEWLVIAGAKAMFKGDGTINGAGNFGFILKAIDEKLTPSSDVDLFSIKIWDKDDGDAVVYDNGLGDATDADPTYAISGGQIVIHKKK